jgi:multidrug efflux pump subunit AcrA (membrane-fusion protein)
MYENQMATARDLNDAENETINNRTLMLEMEARFRSLGFNPNDLENSRPNSLLLIADVPESQLKEVQKGESVDIYFSSSPQKKFTGRAESIGDVVDPTTRSVRVRVSMPNYEKFLPGMYAIVDFGDPIKSVVTLPNSSIITVEGKDYAFVESSVGIFTRREVLIGQSDSSKIIILKGIENGETVVTDGAILLKGLSFGY